MMLLNPFYSAVIVRENLSTLSFTQVISNLKLVTLRLGSAQDTTSRTPPTR